MLNIDPTGTVSIVIENNNGHILALRRSPHKKYHANTWNMVSGKMEEGETVPECAKRELFEELGVTDFDIIQVGNPYVYKEPDGATWHAHPIKCKIRGTIRLNHEHTEYQWMSVKDFLKLNYSPPALCDLREFYKT